MSFGLARGGTRSSTCGHLGGVALGNTTDRWPIPPEPTRLARDAHARLDNLAIDLRGTAGLPSAV